MTQWVVVFVSSSKAHLCKWYGDHYEVEAEGTSTSALKRIADELNGAQK
jgi:hypothetical protein